MTEPGSPISLYRQERRAQEIPGMRREDLGTVVRYTPTSPNAEGLVCFTRVTEADLHAEIARHIAHFRAANVAFEWKVYDSDEPASLRDRLRSARFEEGEPESLMVYETRKFTAVPAASADVQILRIDSEAKLGELVRLQERVWNRSFEWLLDMLQKMWSRTSFYAAYDQDHVWRRLDRVSGRLAFCRATRWRSAPCVSQTRVLFSTLAMPHARCARARGGVGGRGGRADEPAHTGSEGFPRE